MKRLLIYTSGESTAESFQHGKGKWQGWDIWVLGGTAPEAPLASRGKIQARAIGDRLLHLINQGELNPATATACVSDEAAAMQTADIALHTAGLAISVALDPRLREINYGSLSGKPVFGWTMGNSGALERVIDLPNEVQYPPTGNEIISAVTHRVQEALGATMDALPEDGTGLVIGHADALYHTLKHLGAKIWVSGPPHRPHAAESRISVVGEALHVDYADLPVQKSPNPDMSYARYQAPA